ncbi:TonB family protein [bacterium]|nr:TonB family protein [bacterium]
MTLIGNNDGVQSKQKYTDFELPATVRNSNESVSLFTAFIISLILHPLVLGVLALTLFILSLLGINLTMLQKPNVPMKDIEFVLVDKEQAPINKNTRFRADRNSRAGGKHDPNRLVSMPSPDPKTLPKPKNGGSAPKTTNKKTEKKAQQPTSTVKDNKKPDNSAPAPKNKPNVPEAPNPMAPRPSTKPAAPKTTTKPQTSFVIPTSKSNIPPANMPSGGPVTKSNKSGIGTGTGTGGTGKANPSFSPSASSGNLGGNGRFSGSGSGSGTGTSSGTGNIGNPGPGNPNGTPGIDAVKQADFGPYMRELQRRIKMNWDPPKGNESKRVVLLFSIAKDGRLLGVKVLKSSGLQAADRAAVSAVELTAPFKPLPSEYKRNSVDIQFTFDYNVFGVSGY